jgi:hypothetical protein
MRKLKITNITNSAAMPVKSGSLEHIQLAAQEAISSTVKGLLNETYDPTKGYILHGCVNSGTGANYVISAGAVYINGEVYQIDAASFSISGSNVAVGVITTTSYTGNGVNADPVAFTDGNTYNVHDIRKIVFQAGLSGSGAFDYIDGIRLQVVQVKDVLTKSNTTSFTPSSNFNPATKKYVDDQIATVNPQLKIKAYGTKYLGDIPSDFDVSVSIGITLPSANYIVMITLVGTNASKLNDNNITFCVYDKTTTQFSVAGDERVAAIQNLSFDWIIFQA